jgi:hypothetical protein
MTFYQSNIETSANTFAKLATKGKLDASRAQPGLSLTYSAAAAIPASNEAQQ